MMSGAGMLIGSVYLFFATNQFRSIISIYSHHPMWLVEVYYSVLTHLGAEDSRWYQMVYTIDNSIVPRNLSNKQKKENILSIKCLHNKLIYNSDVASNCSRIYRSIYETTALVRLLARTRCNTIAIKWQPKHL